MKSPINCDYPRAKLLSVPLISVISGVPVEYQKVAAKVLKIFHINRFTEDSNDYALLQQSIMCSASHAKSVVKSFLSYVLLFLKFQNFKIGIWQRFTFVK